MKPHNTRNHKHRDPHRILIKSSSNPHVAQKRLQMRCALVKFHSRFASPIIYGSNYFVGPAATSFFPTGRSFSVQQAPTNQQDDAYCVDLVKSRDRESYLCGLLVPAANRSAFFALRAFNVELASIKDQQRYQKQSPSTPGGTDTSLLALQLRMQWWRDAVAKLYEEEDASESTLGPVIRSLARAHDKTNFTHRFLERIIDIREADFDIPQYQTVEALSSYVEDTMSSLLYLILESLDCRNDEADRMAFHAGMAIGLTTTLRAIPFKLGIGEHPLPAELVPADFRYDLLETDDSVEAEAFRDACRVIAELATQHFVAARNLQRNCPPSFLLTMVPSLNYLSKLEDANYKVLDDKPMMAGKGSDRLHLLLVLGRTWLTGVV